MFALVLFVCGSLGCSEHRDPTWIYADSMACLVHGQMQAATWLRDRPSMTLKSLRCEPPPARRRAA